MAMVRYEFSKEIKRAIMALNKTHSKAAYDVLKAVANEAHAPTCFMLSWVIRREGLQFAYYAPKGRRTIPFHGRLLPFKYFEVIA